MSSTPASSSSTSSPSLPSRPTIRARRRRPGGSKCGEPRALGGLLLHTNPLEPIERRLKEHESRGTDPTAALADIESAWAKEADDAKQRRFIGGGISIAIGAVLAGIGTAMILASDSGEQPPTLGVAAIGGGGFGIVTGISTLVGEMPLERSHRMWKTVRARPETTSNISAGFSVLPGGGGAASFALTF